MHFMFSLLGVSSQNVHCVDRRSRETISNHCIIRINDLGSYIDASYGDFDNNKFDFYLVDSDKLMDTHILNVYERLINEEMENERFFGQERVLKDEYIKKNVIRK